MAQIWQGIVKEYAKFLPEHITKDVVTLGEGGYPLIRAKAVEKRFEELLGASLGTSPGTSEGASLTRDLEVYVKFEGRNPTGSFKDRGMTAAISAHKGLGTKVVVCASTGNTSASAAAYATAAGMQSVVLVPDGKIAMGKLAQAVAHGAKIFQVDGNFDDCLILAQELSTRYPVGLVNSVNPDRIEGQKTASFEVIDELGEAPVIHALPVGNAGNITAYWKGYKEYQAAGKSKWTPQMWGFQAEGAAPIVNGEIVQHPETIATAIRIGNPASWKLAENARDESSGLIDKVSDAKILEAHRILSAEVGVFVEPASAAGLAGLLKYAKLGADGRLGQVLSEADRSKPVRIVITSTGHGLKDPAWALNDLDDNLNPVPKPGVGEPIKVPNDLSAVANLLNL